MWVDSVKGSRRGQMLVLFAILDAANYRYVIEYSFHDDGRHLRPSWQHRAELQ